MFWLKARTTAGIFANGLWFVFGNMRELPYAENSEEILALIEITNPSTHKTNQKQN